MSFARLIRRPAPASYNATQFSNPLHIGLLKGDMNVLAFDPSYVLATLVRP